MGLLTNSLIGSSRSLPKVPSRSPNCLGPGSTDRSLLGRLSYRDRSSPNMKRYVRDPYFRNENDFQQTMPTKRSAMRPH
jgi:hypothetical protein